MSKRRCPRASNSVYSYFYTRNLEILRQETGRTATTSNLLSDGRTDSIIVLHTVYGTGSTNTAYAVVRHDTSRIYVSCTLAQDDTRTFEGHYASVHSKADQVLHDTVVRIIVWFCRLSCLDVCLSRPDSATLCQLCSPYRIIDHLHSFDAVNALCTTTKRLDV